VGGLVDPDQRGHVDIGSREVDDVVVEIETGFLDDQRVG